MKRKWLLRWLRSAREVASWSKDPNTRVGCVIVRPNNTRATEGYNGLPQGVEDSPALLGNKHRKNLAVLHAEMNALLWSIEDLTGATAFIWGKAACAGCASALIQRGIAHVVMPPPDPESSWFESQRLAVALLREKGVAVTTYKKRPG